MSLLFLYYKTGGKKVLNLSTVFSIFVYFYHVPTYSSPFQGKASQFSYKSYSRFSIIVIILL